jgi:uncharacterized lipoprotein YddW (UPF0748 family)
MKTKIFTLIICALLINITFAQQPKRELRGAWIATVNNIDWPTVGSSAATQQAQLISILDQHQQSGLNTVFFQIRTQCDALYQSNIEPWSSFVSGTQGTNPGYDPLTFAINECKKRGLEFHAWINPYRAVVNYNQIGSFAANHIAVLRPDLLLSQGTLRILDPGKTEVWEYVIKVVMDVVRRYDIDGIHFDDYFYPYPPSSGAAFNDSTTYNAFPRGFTNIFDWRRANVDSLIKRTNDSIQIAKPWVKFGVSPFGIWRNQASDATGSATNGLQSYSDIYANSKKWIQNNWVDYLAPQLYWSIGFTVANYGVLVPWWQNNAFNRHIYSGLGAYRVNNGGTDANWNNPSQIPNQIRLNRTQSKVLGSIFYNTSSVNANPLGMRDSLRQDLWKKPALIPAMSWKDNVNPSAPSNLNAVLLNNNIVQLNWQAPPASTIEMDKVKRFVIYRFVNSTIDLNNSAAITAILPVDSLQYKDVNVPIGNIQYVVTSLDRLHNESTISNTSTVQIGATNINTVIPELTQLKLFNMGKNGYTIHYQLAANKNVSYTIVNVQGKIIVHKPKQFILSGTHQISNILENEPSGTYFIKLNFSGKMKTIPLIKM